jgi:predicted ABC-type ATPase
MPSKFRLFAGPNGSGKSTLFKNLKQQKIIHTEIYVSADSIEETLRIKNKFYFPAYRIQANQKEFIEHVINSTLFEKIENKTTFTNSIKIKSGILTFENTDINSYHASFVASYLVDNLFKTKQSFCFETVMSHISKIRLIENAKNKGYKTYLYYLYTNNVKLNIGRVKLRVQQGEHDVPERKIRDRYTKSISLLPEALKHSDVAYLFDTSNFPSKIVLQKHHNYIKKFEPLPKFINL